MTRVGRVHSSQAKGPIAVTGQPNLLIVDKDCKLLNELIDR